MLTYIIKHTKYMFWGAVQCTTYLLFIYPKKHICCSWIITHNFSLFVLFLMYPIKNKDDLSNISVQAH